MLHGPGTYTQRGLRALGGTPQIGRSIAGVGALGAGLLVGSALGKRFGRKAVEDAKKLKEKEGNNMSKTSGLFMRPSDVAESHQELSAALEHKLNNSDTGTEFKKQGNWHGAALGAVAGGAFEPIRQKYQKPVKAPKVLVEEVKGVKGRIKSTLQDVAYESDSWARKHPMTAALVSAGMGAAAGHSTRFGSGAKELKAVVTGKT